jgi:tetratricopeptide (TPR) repeat protein
MVLAQDPQALFATDAFFSNPTGLNAMRCAPAAERGRAPAPGGTAETESGSPPKPPPDSHAGVRNERGMARRREGDLRGALLEFDVALRLNPRLAVVYNNRGVTRHELGDTEGALADFDEALRLDPDYADAWGNRAALRSERGDTAGAAADCRRGLDLAPGSASLHARRGAVLHDQKDWVAARAEYDRALRLDAGLHWVYLLRGHAQYHTGDWQALCADYRRGFALAASRCAGLVVRTLRSALQSDPAAALRLAEEHVARAPDNPIARAHRGLLLLLLRREAEAEADLGFCRERCAETGPYLDLIVGYIHNQARQA